MCGVRGLKVCGRARRARDLPQRCGAAADQQRRVHGRDGPDGAVALPGQLLHLSGLCSAAERRRHA
eukprot:3907122-Prymnesium_polylepis.1